MRAILIIALFFIIENNSYSQEKTIITNLEGIYIQGWEYSNFMQLDFDNCLLVEDHWAEFAPNVKYNGKPFDFSQIENLEGVYMKVNAVQFTGKTFGHLGSWKSKIIVTEILEIDTNRDLDKCLKDYGPIKRKFRK